MKRRKGGFTLTETLITVAILAIMTAAGATATGVVLSTKNDMVDTANAQILASTALDALADEVRYGRNVKVDAADTITLDSGKFGDGATIEVVKSGTTSEVAEAGEVRVTVTVKDASGAVADKEYALLGKATYAGLKIKELSFSNPDAKGNVTISLTVEGRRGELWSDSRTVSMLNG